MRIAVLADIHGNADALSAALHDAATQGAEQLIVNGDVVNRGPDSVQVMHTLLERSDVTFTLGNHDDLLRLWHARSSTLPATWYDDPFWGATDWSATQLHQADLLDIPGQWPMTLELTQPGLPRVQLAHGTRDHYRESLSDRTDPARLEQLRHAPDGNPYGVLIGSHIHRPVQHEHAGTLILNTGAVGSPATGDPRAQYLLLDARPDGWHATLRSVAYDRAGVLRRFNTSGLLRTGLSAHIFRDELITARSLYTPYWTWTEEHAYPRTHATWTEFLNLNPDLQPV
ncbi:metallophosphoesterase family protein [Deinococcus radiotolerans]|uniref:Metallophosphoesterase n=1 Tax=Deinococcus radiotolerans TaxID=1309407 RepID=A0ABQ2FH59_9DEIO|nr:metallophosphoesterase family protein [Deinococcus radiotolerans]GGK90277.1 metallophosphoesterase [Deinococcus radiotolerans]